MLVTSIPHGLSFWDGCCVLSLFSVSQDMLYIDTWNCRVELFKRYENISRDCSLRRAIDRIEILSMTFTANGKIEFPFCQNTEKLDLIKLPLSVNYIYRITSQESETSWKTKIFTLFWHAAVYCLPFSVNVMINLSNERKDECRQNWPRSTQCFCFVVY